MIVKIINILLFLTMHALYTCTIRIDSPSLQPHGFHVLLISFQLAARTCRSFGPRAVYRSRNDRYYSCYLASTNSFPSGGESSGALSPTLLANDDGKDFDSSFILEPSFSFLFPIGSEDVPFFLPGCFVYQVATACHVCSKTFPSLPALKQHIGTHK
jgi:hypothetical protein